MSLESPPDPTPSAEPPRGERRRVSVLFLDVCGYTALSERLDPEIVTGLLNLLFFHVDRIVRRYDGYLDKFLGDGALVLFGAPRAHEDDAERAVRTAVEVMALLPEIMTEAERHLGVAGPLALHASVATGLVVVGVIGAGEAARYSALGDPVNVAARLLGEAGPGEIVVSEATEAALRGRADVAPIGSLALRGRSGQVRAYRVLRLSQEAEAQRGVPGLHSPLVGRDGELAALRAALDRLSQGQGGLVTVVGAAGVGKSRLVREAVGRGPWALRAGRCVSYATAMPFHPWRELVGALLRTPGLEDVLASLDRAEGHAPLRQQALGLITGEAPLTEDARGQREAAMGALADLLRAASRQRAQVLLLDDAHWVDSSSVALLERIMPLAAEQALLLIVMRRPEGSAEHETRLRQRAAELGLAVTHLDLAPLAPAQGRALVHNLVGGADVLPTAAVDGLVARSEGIPLYIEELLRQARDAGALVWAEERWRCDPARLAALEASPPPGLYALLATHLDRLDPALRARLELASVCGVELDPAHVDHHLGPDPAAWDRLCQAGIVARRTDGRIRWSQPLMQEVVYTMLLRTRRVALHRLAAEALEARPEDADRHVYLRAWHLERSEQPARAALAWREAAHAARGAAAPVEALDLYARAVQADPTLASSVVLERGTCLMQVGRPREAATMLEPLAQQAEAAGDLSLAVRALNAWAYAAYHLGDGTKLLEIGLHAARVARTAADPLNQARALRTLGIAYEFHGRFDEARATYRAALAQVDTPAGALAELWAGTYNSLGEIARMEGDYEAALRYYDLSRGQRQAWSPFAAHETWAVNSAAALTGLGRWTEARDRLRGVLAWTDRVGFQGLVPEITFYLSLALAGTGALDEADQVGRRGLALSLEHGAEEMAGLCERALGLIAATRGERAAAIGLLQSSVRRLQAAGKRPEEAQSRRALDAVCDACAPDTGYLSVALPPHSPAPEPR